MGIFNIIYFSIFLGELHNNDTTREQPTSDWNDLFQDSQRLFVLDSPRSVTSQCWIFLCLMSIVVTG